MDRDYTRNTDWINSRDTINYSRADKSMPNVTASVASREVVFRFEMAHCLQSCAIACMRKACTEVDAGRIKGHCAKAMCIRSDLACNN